MAGPQQLADLPYAAALEPHDGMLAADGRYDCALFDHVTLTEPAGRAAAFMECAFQQARVLGGDLGRARLSDVWLRDTALTGTGLAQSSWLDVTFLGGLAAGVEAYGSLLRRVTFSHSKLDSVNFREAKLTEVRFEDCLLRDVDFSGATLTRVAFAGSRLSKVDFSRASLDEADLRGAELDIIADPGSLRGAIITAGQLTAIAPAIAESLGIEVTPD